MRRLAFFALGSILTLTALAFGAFAVNQNPLPGSVWTWFGPTLGADWASLPNANYISRYPGADPLGQVDSAAALNACLAGAGVNGQCIINDGYKIKVTSADILIPAHTTLKCGDVIPSSDDNAANWSTLGAIRLASNRSIQINGQGAGILGCLIYPGFTLPQTNSTGWTGTAIKTNANADFTFLNSVVFGYDVCIDGFGSNRTRLEWFLMDCNGGTLASKASLYMGNSGDSPNIAHGRMQPLGTNNGDCTASRRDGTGWFTSDQAVVIEDFVVQNYKVNQVHAAGAGIYGGFLWVDTLGSVNAGCTDTTSVGLRVEDTTVHLSHINANGLWRGIRISASNPWVQFHVNDLFLNSIADTCVQLMGGSTSGSVIIDHIATNSNAAVNCGAYAIDYLDPGAGTFLAIKSGTLVGVNGNASPYIHLGDTVLAAASTQIRLGDVVTDLETFGTGRLMASLLPQACQPVTAAAALYLSDHSECFRVDGTTAITSLLGNWDGRAIRLIFNTATIVNNGNNIRLAGGLDFLSAAGNILRLFCENALCREEGRVLTQ